MLIALIIVFLSLFVTWLYIKWILMKNYWTKKGVPQTPIHPILGSMTFLQKKNPSVWLTELYKTYKSPYVGLWVFWRRGLLINCPELARQVLVKDANVFRNRLIRSSVKSDPIGALNLFTVDDPLWSAVRRRLTLVFTGSKLRGWHALYQSKTADLVHRINSDNEKSITIDAKTLFADFSTDIIGESAFGISCQATRNSSGPLREMTKEFEKYSPWRGLGWSSIFFFPELVDIFGFSFWPKHTVEYFRRVFNQVVEERGGYDKVTDGKRDLLDTLIKMGQDAKRDNQDLDVDVLVANAMVFLQGGYDTSSTVLGYIIYELAYHPYYQQRLYEEILEAKQNLGGQEFDASSLAELPFLNAVFKEALRKYPPMGWLDRVAQTDYKINEHLTIPAGTVVYVNSVGMHRDPEYFPDPEDFRPERFLPENADNIKPYTFLPFGEGPRSCIGKRIGQNTVRYTLAALLLNFEVLPLPDTPKPNDVSVERRGLFLNAGEPLHVQFKLRQ